MRKFYCGISLLLLFSCLSASCSIGADNVIQSSDRNMTSLAVKEGSLPAYIVVGHFDEAGIRLIASYSDGTTEEIPVTSSLIPEQYRNQLQTPGTYEIELLINGQSVVLTIHIVKEFYTVNFYAFAGEPEYTLISAFDVPYLGAVEAPEVVGDFYTDEMHYYFTGWDKDFSVITSSLNVYGKYEYIPYYNVTFYDGALNIVKSERIDQGEDAVEPTEVERRMDGFDFVGWDRDYHRVTKNLDIYGIYVSVTGGDPEYTQEPYGGPFITEPVQIQVNVSSALSSFLQSRIAAFQEVEPNIEVQLITDNLSYEERVDQVISQIPNKDYPDVCLAPSRLIQDLLEYDIVSKLDDYIENANYGWSDFDQADFITGYLDDGRSYSRVGTFSLPWTKHDTVLYYNKTLIGLDLSAFDATVNNGQPLTEEYINDLTWEELFDHLAPAINAYNNTLPSDQAILKGDNHYVLVDDYADYLFQTLAKQYGYPFTSLNMDGTGSVDFVNEGNKNLMKVLNQAYQTKAFNSKSVSNEYGSTVMVNQSALLSIGIGASARYYGPDVRITHIPHPAGKARKSYSFEYNSLAILKHDSQRELASWLFCNHLINPSNSALHAINDGCAPLRYSAATNEDYLAYANMEGKTGEERMKAAMANMYLELGEEAFSSLKFKGHSAVNEQVSALLKSCLLSSDIDTAIDGLFENAYLQCVEATR